MMIVRPRMLLARIVALAATPLGAQSTFDQVDAMIGTGGERHTFPGAVAPLGMVQFSPDTDTGCVIRTCYSDAAGYRYDDPTIQGFSLTHFSGAGHSDLADFLMMPVSGDTVPLEPRDPVKPGTGCRSRYDHAADIARPASIR
jgi:putative alpha-1,2-mannosidase